HGEDGRRGRQRAPLYHRRRRRGGRRGRPDQLGLAARQGHDRRESRRHRHVAPPGRRHGSRDLRNPLPEAVMKFLSLVALLVLEQVRPLRQDNLLLLAFRRYAGYLQAQFDGGDARHGIIAWVLAAAPVVAATAIAYRLLLGIHPFAGLAWGVAV